MKKEKEGHVLDIIWQRSQLMYLSDIADIKNQEIVYAAVSNIREWEYPWEQWEEAYQYIFRSDKIKGDGKESILTELKR